MTEDHLVSLGELDRFCREAFLAVGANAETADSATRAMMHGTTLGVDSHGVRLLPHYLTALEGGRLNKNPQPKKAGGFGAVEVWDADHAQGAVGTYRGMARAIELAGSFGIGAVGVRNGSHFGPAGAYAIKAARAGMIGITFCNSDSFVRLHDGAMRFHGTNPIAVAAPAPGQPWLLDMATSAIPYNRVQLYQSLGVTLPESVASDAQGIDTRDAHLADMLAPVGAEFGFKGAALAGVVEIFSAVLTGMRLSFDILPMGGPDMETPREMGSFVLAVNPDAFTPRSTFDAGMARYMNTLRNSPMREGCRVMAPGDREWLVADERRQNGVRLDPVTIAGFTDWADKLGLSLPGA
ncbi:Ldh family oxidoreductase [Paracoccus laeviglucosivorans]|uniref:Malate/lactate/ureidoglycolate dehydrogenase, LDH2 family n=1 Tax=Paracoccus laeviglucosivorans TaxID=1197861 RepID=A0A521F5L4_9RHOB|nr:Ldh family oxidoreductase [Paracoccus laeviglucosivorans]SMO91455.1 Malate/lactate/ureidoglycolate dehydrogenase, LDH2 family [Paracoccus laeviglucosivorans]